MLILVNMKGKTFLVTREDVIPIKKYKLHHKHDIKNQQWMCE